MRALERHGYRLMSTESDFPTPPTLLIWVNDTMMAYIIINMAVLLRPYQAPFPSSTFLSLFVLRICVCVCVLLRCMRDLPLWLILVFVVVIVVVATAPITIGLSRPFSMSTPFRRSTPGKSVPGPSPSSGDDLAHKPSSPSSQPQHGRPSKGVHTTHEEDCSTPPSSTPVAADRSPRALSVPALSARDGRQELSQVRAERSRLEDHRVEMLLGAVYCGASPHALASPTKAKLDEWRVRRANDASPGQREVGFRSPNLSDITHRTGAAMGFFGVEESRAPRFSSARRFQKMYREGEVHFYSTEGADAPAPHTSWPWPASHPSTASTPGPGAYTPQYARRSKPVLPHRE